MGGATDSRRPIPKRIEYLDGKTYYLSIVGNSFAEVYESKEAIPENQYSSLDLTYKDLMSDNIKFFFKDRLEFFHFLTEVVPVILLELELAKQEGKSITILIPPVADHSSIRPLVDDLLSRLAGLGVSYLEPPSTKDQSNSISIFPAKNLYTLENSALSTYTAKLVRDFYRSELIKKTSDYPSKRVFLSRKNTLDSSEINFETLRQFRKNNFIDFTPNYPRVDNEEAVSNFMQATWGTEVITPDSFTFFKDQVEFFNSVEVLVSVTGSGLTNCMFMQPGTLLVELVTPLVTYEGGNSDNLVQSYHGDYSVMAAQYGIMYLAIPHDRSAEQIIELVSSFSQILTQSKR